jgi:glycosyltransferase involved in cell wall biosynthesis
MTETPTRQIVVLCPYPENRAPSQRLKFEQYYPSWRAAGFEVDVRPFWDEDAWAILHRPGHTVRKMAAFLRGMARRRRDLRDAARADLVYVHLDVIPLGPPVMERRLLASGVPVVYDIDDMVHLGHASAGNPFMRRLRGRERIETLLEGAREVVVCTEVLDEFAREHNDRVTNISSTVETRTYAVRDPSEEDRGVTLGWSGSHSTAPYLHLLDDVIQELAASDGVRLRVIGDAGFRIPGVDVDARPWRLDSEVEDLQGIDIGLYPLPHEPWVYGKSGLKALQYMGVGVPVVAERIGTNLEIITEGENGFLAEGRDEWLERIRTLIRDPALRRDMGRKGRRVVEDRYSVEVTEPVYLGILRRALDPSMEAPD